VSRHPDRQISIIIPVLNEAERLAESLESLQALRRRGHEIIVIDGGSVDGTIDRIEGRADRLLETSAGRSVQMNAGARLASGEVLWFVHVDTRVPADADRAMLDALSTSKQQWGRFDVALSGRGLPFRIIATMMNIRSRITGIVTGDQGLFVTRKAFVQVGGFPSIALMEDIAISQSLKRIGRPLCLSQRLVTSSRRWEEAGVMRTILLMWALRLGYAAGVDPVRLARLYQRSPG
jgi:rSAM/selenodomain-associated transferase 2